jgi:hypothetical protein
VYGKYLMNSHTYNFNYNVLLLCIHARSRICCFVFRCGVNETTRKKNTNPSKDTDTSHDRKVVGFTTTCTISAYHHDPNL